MKDKPLSEGEVKARLAQAEAHFSHYRWDDAIATFEAVLASYPDHPAAAQGWASAVEQKSIDEELSEMLSKARASLTAHRFDEALSLLNHAQARGALSHILRYHSEIDGLRSEAQEGQEWQRRVDAAAREADGLASRRRFDQALEVLDDTLAPLRARGWERLGAGLAAQREQLWAERDVSERVQFAQAAYEREDYGLATELAAALREELPGREDVRRLHERARGAWGRIQERLTAVNEALAEQRTADALALLAAQRAEHPRNPDWQAIALRVHMNEGRAGLAKGRAAMAEQAFEDAAEAFEAAQAAFTTVAEIFPQHPTAEQEQNEALALRHAALSASQAASDRAAFRWEASRIGWQASRAELGVAMATRGRDFGEVAVVVDAMLAETQAALVDFEHARLMLADGRQALEARDAGSAREAFRAGLSRIEGGRWGHEAELNELRDGLAAGLREAERIQREVKKLLSQANAANSSPDGERLSILRRAYERWETAPGLATQLSEALIAAAAASAESGDEDAALAYCREAGELPGAGVGVLTEARRMTARISSRREAKAALAEAAGLMEEAAQRESPSPEPFNRALAILDAAGEPVAGLEDLAPELAAIRQRAEDARSRAHAAQPGLARSEAHAAAGAWRAAAEALAGAREALGPLAGSELDARLADLRARAAAVDEALALAEQSLRSVDEVCEPAANGELTSVDWDAADEALSRARKALLAGRALPPPLPQRFEELKSRVETLQRRNQVLRRASKQIGAGDGISVLPALQEYAAREPEPLVLAALERLMRQSPGEAADEALHWQAQAAGALERAELAAAEACVALAQSFAAAAPQVIPQVRRIERQISLLTEVREQTREARRRVAVGDVGGALAGYRSALELAADGEGGLPADARRQIHWLLDREDALEEESPPAGLIDDAAHPLVREFVAPALGRWWRLTRQAAALARVESLIALGREATAAEAAAELSAAYPGNTAAVEAYRTASALAGQRQVGRLRRRMRRALRLAEQGAYTEALAEIGSEPTLAGDHGAGAALESPSPEVEELVDEAAGLRLTLHKLVKLSGELVPQHEQMRELALAGQFDEALRVFEVARLIDPGRRASAAWAELDELAAQVEKRRAEGNARMAQPGASERAEGRVAPDTREADRPAPSIPSPPGVRPQGSARREPGTVPRDVPPAARRGVLAPEALPLLSAKDDFPSLSSTSEEGGIRETKSEDAEISDRDSGQTDVSQPAEALEGASTATEAVAEAQEPAEPAAPFDLDEWLSNVTELGPDDEGPGNES